MIVTLGDGDFHMIQTAEFSSLSLGYMLNWIYSLFGSHRSEISESDFQIFRDAV